MTAFFLSFALGLRDILLAAYDILTGRKRRLYRHSVLIRAPRETVWKSSAAPDITYEQQNLRILEEPVPGMENVYRYRVFTGGEMKSSLTARRLAFDEGTSFKLEYLPDHSQTPDTLGDNDIVTVHLAGTEGGTRYEVSRELTHRKAGTRITAPLGLRMAGWLTKTEAERRAGNGPTPAQTRRSEFLLALAAVASFAALMGLEDAIIVTVLVILHELGHAAAMLAVGLPVGFVRLIPFFGGMAAPKRPFDNDWQLGFVALMGPGLSLIPTALLLWLATTYDWRLAAHAAVLFAVINGANLLPLSPLDGGVIVSALARTLHHRAGRAVAWTGTAAGLAFSIQQQSLLLALVFVLSTIQLITQSSLNMDARRKKLAPRQAVLLFAGFAAALATYVWLGARAFSLEGALDNRLIDEMRLEDGATPSGR